MVPALDERSQSILLELVQDHIEKAEPVGSRSLAKSHFNKLSPATIRNVMSDLEEMGYYISLTDQREEFQLIKDIVFL